jgi:tetratricopeptide (TPR) repeat protein
MGISNISEAIYLYQNALAQLSEQPTQRQILQILHARDRLAHLLQNQPPISIDDQEKLTRLDQELKSQANLIVENSDLETLRESINPNPEAWWWFPEQFLKPHKLDKHDWAWRGGTLIGWTINLALLTDIASRFISGGLGFGGAGAIIFPSLLTILKARGDLTEVGQAGLRQFLGKIGIKPQLQEEATAISTLALLIVISGFWVALPKISDLYNYLGYQAHGDGDIPTAQSNYQRAIALNEDNMIAHYNLGLLYEDLRQIDAAKKEYEIVTKADPKDAENNVAFAQNNLARLLILEEDYSNAVVLLKNGISNLENITIGDEKKTNLEYALQKNLGWARYKQGLYDQANDYLKAASELAPDKAAAYCLQAQNFTAEKKNEQAIAAWKKCCALGNSTEPDQDQWLVMAHKALAAAKETCAVD